MEAPIEQPIQATSLGLKLHETKPIIRGEVLSFVLMPKVFNLGKRANCSTTCFLKCFCMPLIRQNPPASTTLPQTASKHSEGISLSSFKKEQAILCSSLSGLPKKRARLIFSGMNFSRILRMLRGMRPFEAGMAAWVLRISLISSSEICLSRSRLISLLMRARSSRMNLFRFCVPIGRHWKARKSGQPSQTAISQTVLAPADTTSPEYLPVRQSGVTQLNPSSTRSIFSLRNMILVRDSRTLRSVQTLSSRTTVLPAQEQLMQEKKMLQRSSSRAIQYLSELSWQRRTLPDRIVFLGTLSPTRPTRMNSLPSSMMMSSFLALSIYNIVWSEQIRFQHDFNGILYPNYPQNESPGKLRLYIRL